MSLLIIFFRDNGLGHSPEGLPTPGVILMASTRDAGLNFSLCLALSSTRCRSPALCRPGLKEVSSWIIWVACIPLYGSSKGRASPPLLSRRKRMEVFADLARRAHLLRVLVAKGCSSRSSQVIRKCSTSRERDSLGETPCLKSLSFCWRVKGVQLIADSICFNCSCREALAVSLFL